MLLDIETPGQGIAEAGWVTVLGPVSVDGETLTDRQRSIVTALVLRRERGATTDQLIDAVWPWDVPRAARPALHNQISRLRRRFGDDAIVTAPDGYRIQRASDVAEFERLVTSTGDGRGGAELIAPLEQALALWQGRPFSALDDHPDWEGERARVLTMRATAIERLAAARIAAGDVVGATSELVVFVEEHPYQERGWELLMEALYRDGRRVEALAAYARLAKRLQADLGVRPSASVLALRDTIDDEAPMPATGSQIRQSVLAAAS